MASKLPNILELSDDLETVDPWINGKPDANSQTGGDWYSIALSASLGGKTIHGVNTAPTMELLGKTPAGSVEHFETGHLRWDPNTTMESKLGPRISDQFYLHHQYRGGETSTGAILAFGTGSWEPSLRARARSTSMLAAGIAAHGCSKQDALTTASIIAGDQVDAEAVDATILPASHLKREMTIVAKPNHRLFSQGTIQKGISWDDHTLSVKRDMPHIAYDWGRITAIARYIAEANVQVCPKFREEAQGRGIPFHLVRNAWAAVAAEDYNLPPEMFETVRKIKIDKYGIPTLRGAYIDHESEIMASLTKFMNSEIIEPAGDAYKGLAKIYERSKRHHAKRQKIRSANTGDISDKDLISVGMSTDDVSEFLKFSQSAWTLLVSAVATRRKHDHRFNAQIEQYLRSTPAEAEYLIDNLTRATFGKATWALCRAEVIRMTSEIKEGSERESAKSLLFIQLSKLKSKIFGLELHLDSAVYFVADVLEKMRSKTKEAVNASSKAKPMKNMTQHEIVDHEYAEIEHRLSRMDEVGRAILVKLQTEVAKTFKQAFTIMLTRQSAEDKQLAVDYYFAYHGLKSLGIKSVTLKNSDYVDGSNPKDTYIYKACKKLAAKLQLQKPTIPQRSYANAKNIASDIQKAIKPPYNLYASVAYSTSILDDALGDLLNGIVYQPINLITFDEAAYTEEEEYPGQADMRAAEDADILQAMMNEMMEDCIEPENDPYTVILNSYPSAEVAEQYAKACGYDNFQDAWIDQGDKAVFSDESDFCIRARSVIAKKAVNSAPKYPGSNLGYKPML
jgi:hypothetical protein